MITLSVNGSTHRAGEGSTVADLVRAIRPDGTDAGPARGIAVARNEDVVPRSAWATTAVEAGDRIEILDAAQGG